MSEVFPYKIQLYFSVEKSCMNHTRAHKLELVFLHVEIIDQIRFDALRQCWDYKGGHSG